VRLPSPGRRRVLPALLLASLLLLPAGSAAQNATPEVSQSQARLQEIRRERSRLRDQLKELRSRVRNASSEMENIRRQITTSESLLREMDSQLARTETEIQGTTRELLETQDRLAERRALLHRRLRDIYKRGPLHDVQVLLTAESFGDLLNRYKYLYLVARHDRALVEEVATLEAHLALRERHLRRSLDEVQLLKGERVQEHQELRSLAQDQGETLSLLQRQERSTTERMEQLARDERRLSGLLATLERRRREGERPAAPAASRPGAPAARPPAASSASRLTTADYGTLGWPVEGSILYRFGRTTTATGTVLRWNGVGIGAAVGTPVRAVEAGTVVFARPFEGYGPSVVLSHGGGYYSLYLYLSQVGVQEGAEIARGQVVGAVGGGETPEGPHLEFQIRAPGGRAVDPMTWLKKR